MNRLWGGCGHSWAQSWDRPVCLLQTSVGSNLAYKLASWTHPGVYTDRLIAMKLNEPWW